MSRACLVRTQQHDLLVQAQGLLADDGMYRHVALNRLGRAHGTTTLVLPTGRWHCMTRHWPPCLHRLVIVDSVTSLFRIDFQGRGELADRQQKLNQFMGLLTRMSEEFNVAVYITNQVTADPGALAAQGEAGAGAPTPCCPVTPPCTFCEPPDFSATRLENTSTCKDLV